MDDGSPRRKRPRLSPAVPTEPEPAAAWSHYNWGPEFPQQVAEDDRGTFDQAEAAGKGEPMRSTPSTRFGLGYKLLGCGWWMLWLMNQQDAHINDDDAAIRTNRTAVHLRNNLSKSGPPTPEEQWELLNHGELFRRLFDWNQRILSRLIQRQQRANRWQASNDDGGIDLACECV